MLCICAAGCRQDRGPAPLVGSPPEAAYREIERQFVAGDLPAAQHNAETASQRYGSLSSTWSPRFQVELARVYLYEGRYADVITLLRHPLPTGVQSELVIRQNILLAVAEASLGNNEAAENAFANAKALHPQAELQAELVNFEGVVAIKQGRFHQAEQLIESALDEGQNPDGTFVQMQMWMNLGVAALQLEHYDDALERFTRASILAQSTGARLAREKALGNLAWTYYQTGDFARAEISATEAERQAIAIGARLDQAQWLRNIGESQTQKNDLTAARFSFEKSLDLAAALNDSWKMFEAHIALAYLYLHEDPAIAQIHIRESARLARLRNNEAEGLEPLLLEGLLLGEQGRTTIAEVRLISLAREAKMSPHIRWVAENTVASLYVKEGKDHEADRWFQRAIATFHQQRLTLKSVELELPFLENGNDLYLGYMEHLIHEGRTEEALAVLDSSRAEALAEGLGTSSARSAKLQGSSARALAARLHATILVYCFSPETSYLWAINAKRTSFYNLPGSTAILPLVARHTQAILTSKDLLTQKDDTGQQLYKALVQPAESTIGHGGRVYLIADKGLGGLNFETLVTPGDKPHYWIEDVTLTNARSLGLLAVSKQAAPGPRKLLLVGDPLYRAEEFPALPNAAAEMTSVAAHFTPDTRTIAAGANASPTTYTADGPGKFAYIHFVAHATANETNPLDSAIILSTPPGTPANHPAANRLYARDILQKPLDADLVTISSCYGSGTRNYSGEGVVGLVWAFLRAGAHSVIGASWEVSDVSTPQLMDALYTRLLSGDQPDEALRSGKLAMIRGNGIYRKPLYWAAFQLYTGR